jgi:hypothetical protein
MKLIKNQEIEEQIIGIIKEAKNSIVIVSPYINFGQNNKWEELSDLLSKRSQEGLFIEVHTRENQNNKKTNEQSIKEEDIIKKFMDITLGNIYLHMNLHAKLYFNEEKAIVTTLNITQSSRNNIEIGYLIEKEDKTERNELLNNFYYPVLINTHPELVNKDDNDIIKNRKSFLEGNLRKLAKDIEISSDDSCKILNVYTSNYNIEVKIKEEPVCCELPPEELSDVSYNLYFYITIKNENYKMENPEENISRRYDELLVLSMENNHITILFSFGSLTRVYPKHLLIDNYWFENVNGGLFHLIKILEENAVCA